MKLLLVEDNRLLAGRVMDRIPKTFTVDHVTNGEDAISNIRAGEYGVILLDLGLPDMPGLDVCRHARRLGCVAPILVLTGLDDIYTRVSLLQAGADDYMAKPFDSRELRARIEALCRRQPLLPAQGSVEIGDLVINNDSRSVIRAGIEIPLRRKEFDILEYMVQNRDRVITRDMIMHNVWSSDTKRWANTVDVHIKNLRDKIDRPFDSPIIKTVYGIGYKVEIPEEIIIGKEYVS